MLHELLFHNLQKVVRLPKHHIAFQPVSVYSPITPNYMHVCTYVNYFDHLQLFCSCDMGTDALSILLVLHRLWCEALES